MSKKRRRVLPGSSAQSPFRRGRSLPGQSESDDSSGLTIKVSDRPSITIISDELVRVGDPSTGNYVEIGLGAIKLIQDGLVKLALESDGDIFLGQDISDPAQTHLVILSNDQNYNDESLEAGDLLIGDNGFAQPNMLWDKSSGQLQFRAGANIALTLDDGGIKLISGVQDTNKLKVDDSGSTIAELYAQTETGVESRVSLIGRGKDSDTHEGAIELVAITDDGQSHAGSAGVNVELTTSNKQITLSAERNQIQQLLNLGTMTTTQRDALSPTAGAIIFNTTTTKFQGYTGAGWVNLH